LSTNPQFLRIIETARKEVRAGIPFQLSSMIPDLVAKLPDQIIFL